MNDEKLSAELAEKIKKKIWQYYFDSDLSQDMVVAFKAATDAVDFFVENKVEKNN